MLSRRMFLSSASAMVVAFIMPPAAAAPLPAHQDKAIRLILDVVQDFYTRIYMEPGFKIFPKYVHDKYFAWMDARHDPAKLVQMLQGFYESPVFADIRREYGSIVRADGRMDFTCQDVFASHFPMVLDRGNRELFAAFLEFAPAHLV